MSDDKRNKRVIILLLDSVGCGAAPDAALFGDEGANTLGHIAAAVNNFALPNLSALGLGNIPGLEMIENTTNPKAAFGRMRSISGGKDTTCGHWEIAGTPLVSPLPTYPNAFPAEVMDILTTACGLDFIGNEVASGTEIIARLGEEHQKSGKPIIYTSADSVCQIAAHEESFGLERLYDVCLAARQALQGPHGVGRVIARPFIGNPGSYTRTDRRRDFSLLPPPGNLLEQVKKSELPTVAIGKINDIFAGANISAVLPSHSNQEGMKQTETAMRNFERGLIWTNLVDFDMLYGHRNDVLGYARALMDFDAALPSILADLKNDDILVITADHGNDPTFPGTDHNREYVPLLILGARIKSGVDLGVLPTFADLGATIADFLGTDKTAAGSSFLASIYTA